MMSAPSCFAPLQEHIVIRPYLVPLLPIFAGANGENPYVHIKDCDEVFHTFQEGNVPKEAFKMNLFPFTLKDKAMTWLHSLRPRSVKNWNELQA